MHRTSTGGIRAVSCGRSARLGVWRCRARLRTALLAVVWTLPGVWCTTHFVAHELEPKHHALHAMLDAGDRIVGICDDRVHRHSHIDSPAVASNDAGKKLGSFALSAAAGEFSSADAAQTWYPHSGAPGASTGVPVASGPRAPPLS